VSPNSYCLEAPLDSNAGGLVACVMASKSWNVPGSEQVAECFKAKKVQTLSVISKRALVWVSLVCPAWWTGADGS